MWGRLWKVRGHYLIWMESLKWPCYNLRISKSVFIWYCCINTSDVGMHTLLQNPQSGSHSPQHWRYMPEAPAGCKTNSKRTNGMMVSVSKLHLAGYSGRPFRNNNIDKNLTLQWNQSFKAAGLEVADRTLSTTRFMGALANYLSKQGEQQ